MKLYNIPYYIDLEGQKIDGITLKPYHVKLLGVIIVHDKLGNGCFASTETLAEEAKLTVGTVKNARADLIKVGIIRAEKDSFGNIKTLIVNDVTFQGWVNHSLPYGQPQLTEQVNHSLLANREATPVLNKSINKNINMCSAYASSANADSAQATQSSSANADSDVSLGGLASSSPNGSSSADIKKELQFPFDEDVDEVSEANVVNLKKVVDEKNKSTRRAAAVAGEVAGILGRDRRQVTPAVVKNMKSVLEDYTHDEVIQMANWCKTQEFWQDKTLLQMIKKDTVAQALMNKKVENKYVW